MTNPKIGPEPARVAELPGRSMLILYGSETGNSQDIAEEIGRDAQRLHFETRVDEMNGAQLSTLLRYTLVVFVISTTGQGDMPRNSSAFWRSLLRKKLPPGCLGAVRFTTFGLGDSMYIKFNWAARKLHKRLEQLGAGEFYPRGEADEQDADGVDERYMPWAADLRKKLLDLYPLPEGLAPIPDDALLPPRYTVGLASNPDTRQSQGQEQSTGSNTNCHAFEAVAQEAQSDNTDTDATGAVEDLVQRTTSITMTEDPPPTNGAGTPSKEPREVEQPPPTLLPIPGGLDASLELNERVTPETHFQDVRLVRLALNPTSGGPPTIQPFDSLTIYPKNFPQDVQKLIDLMGWSTIADSPLSFAPTPTSSSDPSSGQTSLPRGLHIDTRRPTTLRDLLTHNLDITCTPRRSFLKDMSYFSSDEYHRQRLLEFTMREYTDEFFDYTTRPRRTILEVLEEFTSVHIPLARVLDMFPVMRGRDFSIASVGDHHHDTSGPFSSSPKPAAASITTVTLLVALVKYKTILRKTRQGLCSRYLESLTHPGTPLRVALNRSSASLHGPAHARRPLCAVATGTGVAPLRLFVEERLSYASLGGVRVGDAAVFFGNRSRDADFHFRDVWEDLKARYGAAAAETRDPAGPGGSFDVHTAFSRDPSAPRQYVQDVIRQHAPTVRAMVAANAIFVVCGGSLKMARAVKEAVRDSLRGDAERYPDDAAVDAAFAGLTWWEEIW
ncbi:flavodoxin [Colletotrichum graminicola]|uniref:NADPH-dependent diflavin oxidoreductase 1 n=1 Tax=Colletotrichum graminicola (strain M1.001 / M2 / FGSC 10212) TaxID=645133 RepID=E3QA15_COLGM|nr:flavodoxin [Colletotrichum graminicola M1.001]EFQ27703.1 flavodoxin [Colletotrichum graminicola M1.001]WDK11615.1 flavodoxin [Colletotrichum graminicola]